MTQAPMAKTLYLTTPLYYVNAAPHIGHSYTTIAADCLARYHRLAGRDVFLLTGTDEHGQKIHQAATAAGLQPQEFVDRAIEQFVSLWKLLNISHNDFIRTTQPRHVRAVQTVLTKLHDQGKLTRAAYQGWYCTPDETFWTEAELGQAPGAAAPMCPACHRPLEAVKEEGWYLPLRASQPWLQRFVKDHPAFVQPTSRRHELLGMLEAPLPEYLCITRPRQRVSWGISVPFSPDHVVYVWFDALLNYITVPGYVDDPQRFAGLWPADIHLIGKDILRHHAVYWPIMLHELGLPDEQMPRTIFAHGWWKIGEQKMSKSLGNIVDPTIVVGQVLKGQPFAADVYRYFLLREISFGQDGDFSEAALAARFGADLADDLGNLVHRTLSMLQRYAGGKIPSPGFETSADDAPLRAAAQALPRTIGASMDSLSFSTALEALMGVVSQANRYIEQQAPWQLAKDGRRERLLAVLSLLAETLRVTSLTLEPFMPSVALDIWHQLGCGQQARRLADVARWPWLTSDQPIGKPRILFPKAEAARSG